jgi:hypothetical protein
VKKDFETKSRTRPDAAMLVRLLIRDGLPFTQSALSAGYSKHVANSGLKAILRKSRLVSETYAREMTRVTGNLASLKPLAIRRLYSEIADNGSSQGIKAIELAGRFKETDWWVRGQDIQIGVFQAFAGESLELEEESTLDAYKNDDSQEK